MVSPLQSGAVTTVGDYRVEVTRQAAPTASSLPGGAAGVIGCDYPMLLLHVQLAISRLRSEEVEDQEDACFDFLDAL